MKVHRRHGHLPSLAPFLSLHTAFLTLQETQFSLLTLSLSVIMPMPAPPSFDRTRILAGAEACSRGSNLALHPRLALTALGLAPLGLCSSLNSLLTLLAEPLLNFVL